MGDKNLNPALRDINILYSYNEFNHIYYLNFSSPSYTYVVGIIINNTFLSIPAMYQPISLCSV